MFEHVEEIYKIVSGKDVVNFCLLGMKLGYASSIDDQWRPGRTIIILF